MRAYRIGLAPNPTWVPYQDRPGIAAAQIESFYGLDLKLSVNQILMLEVNLEAL
jgi:hypothetical protein